MTEAARRYGFGALAHRNFRLFLFGQTVSLTGTWMQSIAQGWLVLQLTNSPRYVGLVSALGSIGAGQEVFRAWFFQSLATTNGVRVWSAFDHTLAVAKARGVRVIATLANQWGDCEEQPAGVYKTDSWYASGYRTIVRSGTVDYRSWVAEIATKTLANEASSSLPMLAAGDAGAAVGAQALEEGVVLIDRTGRADRRMGARRVREVAGQADRGGFGAHRVRPDADVTGAERQRRCERQRGETDGRRRTNPSPGAGHLHRNLL